MVTGKHQCSTLQDAIDRQLKKIKCTPGSASKYGTGSARKLEFAIFRQYQSRDLQEVDGGFAGSAQFRLDFLVSPDAKFKYGAIAYECDSQSRKIDKTTPKRIGASIRVCITPDNESSAYEMTINRIDSWNWTRQEMASQVSVETGGQQAKNDLTILVCVPGATLCIFRTQFTEDFYKSDGTVNGLGDVVLQFSLQDNDNISVARRRTLVAIPSKKRQLQVPEIAVGLIVGTARVEVKTSVANSINDLPEHCKYDHTVAGWWEEESKKDKIRHIAMAAGILAAVACSICCCWCCPCLARRDEEDKIIEKDGAGNIKVRVDVKTGTKETFISNQSSAQGVSKKRHLSCDDTETSESSIEKHKKKRSSSKIRLDIGDGSAEGGPDVHDVCFDEKSHLGTKELIDAIRRFQTNSPNEHFGPHAYRLIKKELRDVRYFRTTLKGRYVETSKKETVTLLGDLFDQVKRGKLRISGSAKSLNDLESNMEESREVRRGSKRSVQNEKRRRRVLDEAA